MRLLRILSPTLLALIMCVGVTAGSMYVTVSTASLNAAASSAVVAAANAEASAESVADTALRAASVELGSDGSLTGRLSGIETTTGELAAASGVELSVIGLDGSTEVAVTAEDGTFHVPGLSPGAYTVNASGPQGSLSYGIRLVSGHDSVAAATSVIPVSRTLDLQLDSALAPARDLNALQELLAGIDVAPVEARRPAGDGAVETGNLTPRSESSGGSYVGHEQLVLNDDGSLDGRVSLLNPSTGEIASVSDLTAYFITDNQVVARTRVQPDGTFTQYNLMPGIYTMVIAGSDATAYIGVDVIGGLANLEQAGGHIVTSNIRQDGASVGVVQGSDGGLPVDGGLVNDDDGGAFILEEDPFFGSGGAGGVVGGGGAGGGGGMGLLGLAALGAGIAALANNDNGVVIASPAK